ncbi:MAG: UbiA prenyltransferase family protein [Caldilineaceae bacterium SB0662_bin_9]|uniref:UbiA prenyltransferase family protein n=1 Tax=Caldilineaceae bacterium SB0662_bin_9 TaxID=2605258 RepID=A0A6B1DX04_9CHLR|nr:UbiA prenyltransferase family protein [Caldilineaceae bacterium]MYD91911.1 UbiA prenyltransferase family protein [Caldilineaceae bacterium SB0662_bin_9]
MAADGTAANRILPWLRLARPQQWTKNLFVLAVPFFAGSLLDPGELTSSVVAAVSFCLASSAAYAFNDAQDVELDRLHPRKRGRPVADGSLSIRAARIFAALLAVTSLSVSAAAGGTATLWVAIFLLVNTLYSAGLKQHPGLDIIIIALGFPLRVLAGAGSDIGNTSPWLLACAGITALLLAAGKRHSELGSHGGDAVQFRPGLHKVSLRTTGTAVWASATVLAGAYTLYALAASSRTAPGWSMGITIPFAGLIIGLYLWQVLRHHAGEQPELLPFLCKPLLLSLLGYLAATLTVIYGMPMWTR